jgi:hypothetical protein
MNKNEQVKGMANLNRGSVGVQEAQPAPVKVWEAEGYDALMQEMQMVKARNIRQHAEIERLKAAQPAPVPLTDEMRKQMKERCDSMEMRGAFADGWLSAEAAHGIKENT